MNEEIRRLQDEARRIAAKHRQPEFYIRFKSYVSESRRLFYGNPLVLLLRETVEPMLQEDLGHGLLHCTRVSLDCSTLIAVELELNPMRAQRRERLLVLGQMAGLLHDICRDREDHAREGARMAARLLAELPVSADETHDICRAIENHEAFVDPLPCRNPNGRLLSDCLYDADKFRWGPDTFTETLWYMMDHQNITPGDILAKFPWGISGVKRIKDTFRSMTGRQYGPEFIRIGIEIGKEIYRHLLHRYGEHCDHGE